MKWVLDRLFDLAETFLLMLPRRAVALRLSPDATMRAIDAEQQVFLVRHADPVFRICAIGPITHGNYLVSGRVQAGSGARAGRVSGAFSEQVPAFPIYLNGTFSEPIRLPASQAFDLTLDSARGYVGIPSITIEEIGRFETWVRKWHRVFVHHILREGGSARGYATFLLVLVSPDRLESIFRDTTRGYIEKRSGSGYEQFLAREQMPIPRRANQTLGPRERFTIVILAEGTPAADCAPTIESLLNQSDPYFSCLLLCTGTKIPKGQAFVLDDRFQIIERQSVMSCAVSDFMILLKPGDTLAPRCLELIRECFRNEPEAILVYTDHDHIARGLGRHDPEFKGDWNLELFAHFDYVGRAVCYRTARADLAHLSCGTTFEEFGRLFVANNLHRSGARVGHVRHILFHLAETQATAFERRRRPEPGIPGQPKHSGPPGVTVEVVIPSKDNFDVLAACIDSIVSKTIFDRYRITVVENNSQDPRTFAFYRSLETQGIARVLRFDGPFNFSRINNYAVSTTSADILLFLNNDTEILDSSWMARMIGVATRPEVGVVGAKLLYPNGMVQHSGVVLGLGGLAGHVERYIESHDPGYCGRALFPQEISAVTGACMAVRRRVYLEIGGMDEALRVAFNDIDFCIRVMERGYRNIQLNDVVLIHHESLSRGKDDTPAKKRLFLEESRIIKAKHGQRLAEDRYFNPNLSREGECIRFSAPFRGKSFGCDPLVSPLRHAA